MGYFGQGILLKEQPTSDFLEAIPPQYGYSVFAHKLRPIWLLDLVRANRSASHTPFTDNCGDDFTSNNPQLSPSLAGTLSTFAALSVAIDPPLRYGQGWTRLAIYLSSFTQSALFFFAADDELTNFACTAERGNLQQLNLELGPFDVARRDDTFEVQHVISLEDFFEDEHPKGPHYDAPCSRCDRLRGIAGVRVLDTMELEGGRQFYRVPIKNWPPNAGDPQSLLGIGTWDPFTNITADYNVVAQRCEQI